MENSRLFRKISEYSSQSIPHRYLYPTCQNLKAGNYQSEILNVQDAFNRNDEWVGYDFYHKLTNAEGSDLYFRFRYFESELPELAEKLKGYNGVENFSDLTGIKESVNIVRKDWGDYMKIANRSINVGIVANNSVSKSRGISLSKRGCLGGKTHSSSNPSQRAALLDEDDDEADDLLLDDEK